MHEDYDPARTRIALTAVPPLDDSCDERGSAGNATMPRCRSITTKPSSTAPSSVPLLLRATPIWNRSRICRARPDAIRHRLNATLVEPAGDLKRALRRGRTAYKRGPICPSRPPGGGHRLPARDGLGSPGLAPVEDRLVTSTSVKYATTIATISGQNCHGRPPKP